MLKIKEISNKLVKKTHKPEAVVQISSDYWTILDKRSPEVCTYSKWSGFSVSHQDVSVRTRSVLLLATSQRAGICRRNWKCVMKRACSWSQVSFLLITGTAPSRVQSPRLPPA